MTTVRNGRRYLATVVKGEATSLQADKSDVKLEIQEGCPEGVYLMEVRTDLSNFGSTIPNDECFVSPVVGFLAPAESRTSYYNIKVPHCIKDREKLELVKVRISHRNRNRAIVDVPKDNNSNVTYGIDSNFIELHTRRPCDIMCTICDTPYHCLDRVICSFYAKFETENSSSRWESLHDVEIRPYFYSVIHNLGDFIEVMSNTSKQLFQLYFLICTLYIFGFT